jgi:hypothetical protein
MRRNTVRIICLIVGLADGEELAHGELGADEVSADEEAVGEHVQEAGPAGQGRLLLVGGQDRLPLHRPALPVVTVKGQAYYKHKSMSSVRCVADPNPSLIKQK